MQGTIWKETVHHKKECEDCLSYDHYEDHYYILTQIGPNTFLFIDISHDVGNRLDDIPVHSEKDIERYYPELTKVHSSIQLNSPE